MRKHGNGNRDGSGDGSGDGTKGDPATSRGTMSRPGLQGMSEGNGPGHSPVHRPFVGRFRRLRDPAGDRTQLLETTDAGRASRQVSFGGRRFLVVEEGTERLIVEVLIGHG